MTEYKDESKIEALIGTDEIDLDRLPEFMRDSFDRNGDCGECGKHTVGFSTEGIDSAFVCYACGMRYDIHDTDQDLRMVGKVTDKIKQKQQEKRERRAAKSPAQHRKDRNTNLGKMFMTIGALLCLTLIGIPVGLVLIYLGVRLQPDAEDEVEDGSDE